MRALSCYAPVSNLPAAAHFSAKRTAQATSAYVCVCGKEKVHEEAESFIMPVSIAADVEHKSKSNKNKNKNKQKQKHKHKPNARLNNLSHLLFARLARFAQQLTRTPTALTRLPACCAAAPLLALLLHMQKVKNFTKMQLLANCRLCLGQHLFGSFCCGYNLQHDKAKGNISIGDCCLLSLSCQSVSFVCVLVCVQARVPVFVCVVTKFGLMNCLPAK